ncbi:MAG: hypothetical protein NTV29_14510 [Planctomycetota bacterium]|nr:hypothetical protein [Planctomycetota bacterium]
MAKQLALFGLMTALWALNWFPIQRAEKILSARAVVSSQRLPSLQRLSKQIKLPSESIRWVHYSRDLRNASESTALGGIEHIYLRLGVLSGSSSEQIQRELERLTEPSLESLQVPSDQNQLRSERWKLATLEHQMAIFELDRSRERNSQTADLLGDEVSRVQAASTKASAVVYRKLNSETQLNSETPLQATTPPGQPQHGPHQTTREGLLSELDQSTKRIKGLESQLARKRLEASGTIAITGAPQMGVMSTRASVAQSVCVVAFAAMSCLGLSFCLRKKVPQELAKPAGMDSVAMLNRMGLSHFGSIAMAVPPEIALDAMRPASLFASTKTSGLSDLKRIGITRRLVDVLMVGWVGLFAFRFLSDANWRELLFSTPLSAFSSMLLGVY